MINFEKAALRLSIICASIGGFLMFIHFYSLDTFFALLPLLIVFAFMFMVSRSIKMQRATGFYRFKNECTFPLSDTDFSSASSNRSSSIGSGSYKSSLDINPASGNHRSITNNDMLPGNWDLSNPSHHR